MKKSKRIASLLLAVLMAFSAFSGVNFSAFAADSTNTSANATPGDIPVDPPANVLKSAEFIPVKPLERPVNTNGYFDNKKTDYEPYFYYYLDRDFYSEGNKVIITLPDGSKETFTFEYGDYENENGDILSLYVNTNQPKSPLQIGENTIDLIVDYKDFDPYHINATLTIKETEIESVKLNFSKDVSIYEGIGCRDIMNNATNKNVQVYDQFTKFVYAPGNSITVKYKDHTKPDSTFTVDEWTDNKFVNEDYEMLQITEDFASQCNNPFVVDAAKPNKTTIYINGYPLELNVYLLPLPETASIELVTKSPIEINEFDYIDFVDDIEGTKYYEQYAIVDDFLESIILHLGDAEDTQYEFKYNEYSSNCSNEELGDSYVDVYDNQDSQIWTKGPDSNNLIKIRALGLNADVKVNIYDNPYVKAEFVSENPISIIEKTNGYFSNDNYIYYITSRLVEKEGNKIVLTKMVDNVPVETEFVYDYDYYDFVSADGKVLKINEITDQKVTPFKRGDNTMEYSVTGLTLKVNVKITAPIKSIVVNDNEPITFAKYTKGYYYNGNYRYIPDEILSQDPNTKIVVTDEDNLSKTYTYKVFEDEYGDYSEGFFDSTNSSEINVNTDWANNPTFEVGDKPVFNLTIDNSAIVVPVSTNVIANPITSFELIGCDNISINESECSYYDEDINKRIYSFYDIIRKYVAGAKVTYSDGTSEIVEINNPRIIQNKLHTDIVDYIDMDILHKRNVELAVGDNTLTFKVCGLTYDININLKPLNIESVEYVSGTLKATEQYANSSYVYHDLVPDEVKVKINYNDGTPSDIIDIAEERYFNNIHLEYDDAELSTQKDNYATLYYQNDFSTQIPIVINKNNIKTIELVTPPTKTNYIKGFGVNIDGAVIKITYNDGTSENITLSEKDIITNLSGGPSASSYALSKSAIRLNTCMYSLRIGDYVGTVITSNKVMNKDDHVMALDLAGSVKGEQVTDDGLFSVLYVANKEIEIPNLTINPVSIVDFEVLDIDFENKFSINTLKIKLVYSDNTSEIVTYNDIKRNFDSFNLMTKHGYLQIILSFNDYGTLEFNSKDGRNLDVYAFGVIKKVHLDHDAYVESFEHIKDSENSFYVIYNCADCGYKYTEIAKLVDGYNEINGKGYYLSIDENNNVTAVKNKWIMTDNGWVYVGPNGNVVINDWVLDNGNYYYMDANGHYVANTWYYVDDSWYYFDANGFMAADSWQQDSQGWCYVGEDGRLVVNAWKADSHGWCYLDENGRMATDRWAMDAEGWCYLDSNGYMVASTWAIDYYGWCYVDEYGHLVTNAWAQDSQGWLHMDANGHITTSAWVMDSTDWCYVDANGYMVTNYWAMDSTGWCYLDKYGHLLRNGYAYDSQGRHYLDENGHMVY